MEPWQDWHERWWRGIRITRLRRRLRRAECDAAWEPSAADVSGKSDAIAKTDWLKERLAGWVCSWEEHLSQGDDAGFGRLMQRHENTGRPMGDKPLVQKLEALLGRRLLPGQPGRPRKRNGEPYGVPG